MDKMDKKIPLIFGVPNQDFFKNWKHKKAYVAELRPSLVGMKKASAIFLAHGVRPVIVCDNMLAFCMAKSQVCEVHIFCHDVREKKALCRTGSFAAAFCARFYKIPVFLHRGAAMPLKSQSLLEMDGKSVTVSGIKTYVPVFEEVPMKWVRKVKEERLLA